MTIPSIPIQHTLVVDADISTAGSGIDDNYMAVSAIEKVNQPMTWEPGYIDPPELPQP